MKIFRWCKDTSVTKAMIVAARVKSPKVKKTAAKLQRPQINPGTQVSLGNQRNKSKRRGPNHSNSVARDTMAWGPKKFCSSPQKVDSEASSTSPRQIR